MRALLLLAVVFCGAGCKLHESVQGAATAFRGVAEDVRGVTADIRAVVATARTVADELAAARQDADADGDGKTSGNEWLMWLLAGGGGTGGLGLIARNRSSNQWKEEIDERGRQTAERVAKLEAKTSG